jgi:hypothetical protein
MKVVCICKNWCNLANSSQFWKYKVDTFKFGTPEQRVFINSQPEEKQVVLWKKMYREWMRDTEKREWTNSPISFWSDTNWMDEYEWQKDNRTYKKVYWDVR